MSFKPIVAMLAVVAILSINPRIDYDGYSGNVNIDVVAKAEAKSFRSSGFRSSSFRSSSRSSSFKSYSKPKSTPVNKPSKTVNPTEVGRPYAPNTRPTSDGSKMPVFSRTQLASKQASAKNAYKAREAKFKATAKPVAQKSYTPAQRSFVRSSASRYDYGTYYARRDVYYNGWNTPSYVYYGAPSYGIWDTMFLYHMLNTTNAYMFAYHHHNDPGYVAWRREADRQSLENVELRRQLAELDLKMKTVNPATKRNSEYIPDDVDADLALASAVVEDNRSVLRICTGQSDGTYTKIAKQWASSVTSADVKLVSSNGSVDNIEKMKSNQCDAAIVQRDAYWPYWSNNGGNVDFNLTRVPLSYREHVHLACNAKSGIETVDDLSAKNTIYTGEQGAGAAVTWANFLTENENLSNVKVVANGGFEATQKIASDNNACLMYVGAVGNDKFKTLAKTANLKFVDIDDSDLMRVEDPVGNRVYASAQIDESYYESMHTTGLGGLLTYDVDTLTVGVDFIVSNNWGKANNNVYHRVVEQVSDTFVNVDKLNK